MSKAVTAIVLAAGASKRLGRAKQLLPLGERRLLEIVVEAAVGSRCRDVVTILGAAATEIRSAVRLDRTQVIFNDHWQFGIAESIKAGLCHVDLGDFRPDGLLFLVADQPFVSSGLLDSMIDEFEETSSAIVCCRYADTLGVPAIFARELWSELRHLEGDNGARSIIRRRQSDCIAVDFSAGVYDIDTDSQYEAAKNHSSFTNLRQLIP